MYCEFVNAWMDFCRSAKRTYASGIQTGTGGNLSVRVPGKDLMLVKPSGFTFEECSEDNMTITDFDGTLVDGNHKPTQESVLHGSLYRSLPNVGGIVHTHSPYAILVSLNYPQIDLVTMHASLKLTKPIPVVDVVTQSVELQELPKILTLFEDHKELSAFVLKGHGIVALASTAVKAGQIAELVEETAQIFWEQEQFKRSAK